MALLITKVSSKANGKNPFVCHLEKNFYVCHKGRKHAQEYYESEWKKPPSGFASVSLVNSFQGRVSNAEVMVIMFSISK